MNAFNETKNNTALVRTLMVCAAIEVIFFGGLLALERYQFMELVSKPDTGSYVRIAVALTEEGRLIASPRTLGYPIFLSLGYVSGGQDYGNYLVIAAQLLLNLLFSWGCWKLLERIVPAAPTGLKVALTLFFFWAGMGLALMLMSDFLASFFFGLFIFGFLFWRSGSSLIVSASALALATLVRPTFTLAPLLLPVAAYLIGRCTSKVPVLHIVVFIFASAAATGISSIYQYRFQGYLGPSPILAKNIGRTLDVVSRNGQEADRGIDYEAFNQRISERAGKPYPDISLREEEKYAVEFFLEELKARPGTLIFQLLKTVVKYLVAPVESAADKIIRFYDPDSDASRSLRIILALACLPVWLLSLAPPFGSSQKVWAYYFLVALLLAYVIGLTAINPFLGERIRFPVLVFMLPVAAVNFSILRARFSGRRRTSSE